MAAYRVTGFPSKTRAHRAATRSNSRVDDGLDVKPFLNRLVLLGNKLERSVGSARSEHKEAETRSPDLPEDNGGRMSSVAGTSACILNRLPLQNSDDLYSAYNTIIIKAVERLAAFSANSNSRA